MARRKKSYKDQRSTKQLVHLALKEKDEKASWKYVVKLHFRGGREVFKSAKALCFGKTVRERVLGIDILSQLGVKKRQYLVERFKVINETFKKEKSNKVLNAIAVALGYLEIKEGFPILKTLSESTDSDVRWAATYGLGSNKNQKSLDLLTKLSADRTAKIRDWATFSIGTLNEKDNPRIRKALWKRVKDSDYDTKCEAIVGLAQRKDHKIIPFVVTELKRKKVGDLIFEAAELLNIKNTARSGW